MSWIYKIIRAIVVVAILLAILVPAGLFVALSIPAVQRDIRRTAESELTGLLGMKVGISDIYVAPFSRVALRNVTLTDEKGDTAIAADRIGAGVSLGALFFRRRIVVNYAEIIGLDVHLWRDSVSAPLNIQPMIDALAPKDSGKEPAKFDFRVNTVVIRKSALTYDVGSGNADSLRFDANHIAVTDLRADLRLPRISNDNFDIILRRLAFAERSGLRLESLDGEFHVGPDSASVHGLDFRLPGTWLSFGDFSIGYPSLKELPELLKSEEMSICVNEGSYLNPRSFSAFLPELSALNKRLDIRFGVTGNLNHARLIDFALSSASGDLRLEMDAAVSDMRDNSRSGEISRMNLAVDGAELAVLVEAFTRKPLQHSGSVILSNAGKIETTLSGKASQNSGDAVMDIHTSAGQIELTGSYSKETRGEYRITADIDRAEIDGKKLLAGIDGAAGRLETVEAESHFDGVIAGNNPVGRGVLTLTTLGYAGRTYSDINATATVDGKIYGFSIESANPSLDMNLDTEIELHGSEKRLTGSAKIVNLDFGAFGAKGAWENVSVESLANFSVSGTSPDDITGFAELSALKMQAENKKPLDIKKIRIEAEADSARRTLTMESDLADMSAKGNFALTEIAPMVRNAAAKIFPSLVKPMAHHKASESGRMEFDMTMKSTAELGEIVSLPVAVIYPVKIYGMLDGRSGEIDLTLDAPYLQQKGKLLENTALQLQVESDDRSGRVNLYATTLYPTKKGDMTLGLTSFGTSDRLDTQLSWRVARDRGFYGDINLSSLFSRDDAGKLNTLINVNPGELVFNDTVWTISPSVIDIHQGMIDVDGFRVGRSGQYVAIDGTVSKLSSDSLVISLRDVNLDYVFETLDIQTAMFGGVASGNFYAAGVFGSEPRLYTDGLDVKRLSYNHSLMGDTRILSHWDADRKAVTIDAEIHQPNGKMSSIDGAIMPLSDSLDFHFDADRIEIGFMLPFMEAFTSEVSGYASGKARLWGSFKYIDMVGDIYAEDVKLKLDFSNTSYIATDSVRLTPGHIELDNIRLRDIYGNTARLNGWIDHEYFKQPRFRFNITDARNMLVYDVGENSETNWYGRIFGNGNATVTGEPGIVDISVDMQTAANSTFTFVLSDEQQAYDYTFITFRDRDQARKDSIAAATLPPLVVRDLKNRMKGSDDSGAPSIYKMNIAVDVTPSALVTLVMDPVGGDRIRAYGNGNLRMTYDSANEDLRMFGTYTLTRGSYNFTLQDIIIKDFTIREGSSITFQGDPFAAQLDIEAVYSLNANLSDLDESFLQDKEVSRTNVPVHALLEVSGDMRQPDISFDLEFPTLTQDTYRKVRSIVSTEDMMNRQIIYLLALNRFYTPDYMTATKGNELVSVASSTISSQLSSILGQLSENWTIAPTFRSDRGDFSDVEVDLALSSSLLNNRLMLNGNFGYRDKSLNNNSFIGDFDIEYLLNRRGSVRLKAYNRYNDRNFYGRDALTTQGVGVVFKKDFDNIFSFIRKLRHKDEADSTIAKPRLPSDSVSPKPTVPADSVAAPAPGL